MKGRAKGHGQARGMERLRMKRGQEEKGAGREGGRKNRGQEEKRAGRIGDRKNIGSGKRDWDGKVRSLHEGGQWVNEGQHTNLLGFIHPSKVTPCPSPSPCPPPHPPVSWQNSRGPGEGGRESDCSSAPLSVGGTN
jgi:hypothetical protein